jgi:cysteinyl-tRNA synthetase
VFVVKDICFDKKPQAMLKKSSMAIAIYNTFTGKKEEFVPVTPGEVKCYVCGITVYDHSHVGHARSVIVFDVIYRYLRSLGYGVTYVRNYTDIDDKIINRAKAEHANWKEIAETYIASFKEDMAALGVVPPTFEPKATEHIDDMIRFVEKLLERGYAYQIDGSVYFSVRKYDRYGELSGRSIDDMIAGTRIEVDERKKDPLDFALWKESKPGEPFWECPWGTGRPGWHIECSAMSIKYLGNPFDFHGGGKDLIFPHHENERAQAECATGGRFVNYWVHNGFVTMDREKMSKSLGNIQTIKEFLKAYHPEVLRLFFLSTHYRNPIDYSEQSLENAESALQKLYYTLERARGHAKEGSTPAQNNEFEELEKKFHEAMSDDFNTAVGLSSLFDLSKVLNRMIDEHDESSFPHVAYGENLFVSMGSILGLLGQEMEAFRQTEALRHLGRVGLDEVSVQRAIDERVAARRGKDYKKADEIRTMLLQKGITLLDTPNGTTWRIK